MFEDLKKQLSNPDSLVSLFLGLAVVVVTIVLIVNYVKEKRAGSVPTQADTNTVQQQQATGSATLPGSYTVVAGDTLWSIAEKYFSSGYNWVDIAQANKLTDANDITVGQMLTIPSVPKRDAGQVSSTTMEVKKPVSNTYTVKHGDTLWAISLEIYGTGYRWADIATLNKLANPNVIHSGNVLQLP
jgi:nucleoid-associated protein YgaU